MTKIQWNKELSVDVIAIDNQHKQLIDIANTLLEAVDQGADRAATDKAIKKLREYTVSHFNSEEALMAEVRYPDRGHHQAEHRKLKEEVKQFQRELYEKRTPAASTVLSFLKSWLLGHILTYDRKLARFIHDQKAKNTTETVVSIGKDTE